MKKKIIAVLLASALTAMSLAGCGSNQEETAATETVETEKTEAVAEESETAAEAEVEPAAEESVEAPIVTEKTELSFVFADGDEGAKEMMNKVVDNFNAAYPDITVTIRPGNGGAYSELLKTLDSVDEFPDVMEMRDTAVYVRAGKLAPLPDEIVSMFKTTVEFDGVTYTAPMGGENTNGIIYNKAYFDENGFTEPQTYDEFITLCQAIISCWRTGYLAHGIYFPQSI